MAKVIGYTYLSACHCPTCASQAAAVGLLTRKPPLQLEADEHGLAYDLVDRDENPVHPIFDTDEATNLQVCDECGEIIGAAEIDESVARWKASAQERSERRALELQMKNPFNGRFV